MNPFLNAILRTAKIMTIIIVAFVVLVVATVGALNTSSVQNKLLAYATEMLQEKLQTKVEIDSIRIGFFKDDVRLYNLKVEDREQRPMLKLALLNAEVDIWALLSKEVQLKSVGVKGLHAQLFKTKTDSVANYQFLLDAFKPKKKTQAEDNYPEKESKKKATKKLTLALNELNIEDVDLLYNESHLSLGKINLHKERGGKNYGELHKIESSWVHIKKRDSVHVDNHMLIDRIVYEELSQQRKVLIDSVHWTTDNHLPHKRVAKPKRGWYDNGHMNVVARMSIDLNHVDKDSVCGTLTECDINDKASGLHITDVQLKFKQIAEKVHVSNASISMANTTLKFEQGELQLPSKKHGRPLSFSTTDITGTTLLTDIAHPFAPVLKDFKLPLMISTKFSGNDSSLLFRDVLVKTTDNKFHAKAEGKLVGLKDKYKLNVHFDILNCVVQGNSKVRIINQFQVRKFMMKQLQALGTLRYKGSFDVKHKRLEFRGNVGTACGNMQFSFLINSLNKYLTGKIQSDAFELGQAMDYPNLGKIGCKANFKVDISKERTAVIRRQKGGKLPIAQVDAVVNEVKYRGIKVANVSTQIVSDGAIAEGKLQMKGKKLADILCSFSFTDTNDMKKVKIKPGIRFHSSNKDNVEKDKADNKVKNQTDREKQKAERKEAKIKKREAKKEQRAAKKAAKKNNSVKKEQ